MQISGSAASAALLAACVPAAPGSAPATEGRGRVYEGQTLTVAGMSWMWEGTKPMYEEFIDCIIHHLGLLDVGGGDSDLLALDYSL